MPPVSAMEQPFWLKPGYVLNHHCLSAAKKQEKGSGTDSSEDPQTSGDMSQANVDSDTTDTHDSNHSNSKPKVNRSGPLTHDEIATEAASILYRVITALLYRSRAASKVQLFHDLTYLFSGWGSHNAIVDQSTLTINWESNLATDVDYVNTLPRTKIILPNDRRSAQGNDVHQIDLDNIAHLQTIISEHPELSLIIQHEVLVDGNARTVRYRLSLIEVACRTLSAYITLESAARGKDALCADKRSFKAIMVLALGLRRLMKNSIELLNSHNFVPWLNNTNAKGKRGRPRRSGAVTQNNSEDQIPPHKFDIVNGLSLDQLMPPPSKQKEILNQLVLNMTEEEYNSKMQTVGSDGATVNSNVGMAVFGSEGVRIEADENEGVFGF